MGHILQLNGVNFDWKEKKRGSTIGFIAQDVQKIIPELVKEVDTLHTENETHLTLDYVKLVPVLVEAVKEQQEQIEELREEVKILKSNNNNMGKSL